jgi:hypothetical protein
VTLSLEGKEGRNFIKAPRRGAESILVALLPSVYIPKIPEYLRISGAERCKSPNTRAEIRPENPQY